ncbi:phage tail assembly chaperone [Peribacillus loiseleuriae]|uniref:phage tail assembly chaperone n=1 Tax=Peribacillus loiseleuriae TaxID=1679170 RepID=UPI003CFE7B4D
MGEIKKLTLTDLMKDKEKYQIKKDSTEDLYIDRLGASITIRKPERSLCMEAFQMANDENQVDKADLFAVYNMVVEPNLKDPQLQKEFGCVEPTDIVEKLFESGEITQIAQFGLQLAGYSKGIDKVTDLKN